MVLCATLLGDNSSREEARKRMEHVARQIQTMALEHGLGVHFSLAEFGVAFHAALLKHLGLADANGYPKAGVVAVEVTSGPLMTCIENAVPDPLRLEFPSVEDSPLYRFLYDVFAMPDVSSICVYFEEEGDHVITRLPGIPSHEETTLDFLNRFKIIPGGLGYGIFWLRPL
jgi:hypothetical protein